MIDFPEPRLTATVYDQGQHDRLLDEVIRPFWETSLLRRAGGFLWTMRFGARGEHLKLRIHGPEGWDELTRNELAADLDAFVETLPDEAEPSLGHFPPVDPEDEEEGWECRSWRFTSYQPSPFVLGADVLVEDATFRAHHAWVQGAVAEVVLDRLASAPDLPTFDRRRQGLAVQLLAEGLGCLPITEREREAYLRYHRDWLVRHLLAKTQRSEAATDEVLGPLDAKLKRLDRAIGSLRARMAEGPGPASISVAWTGRLRALWDHITRYRGVKRYDLDPFTDDHAFLPLFKTLHSAANQLGLSIAHEVYSHHMLLAASRPPTSKRPADAA